MRFPSSLLAITLRPGAVIAFVVPAFAVIAFAMFCATVPAQESQKNTTDPTALQPDADDALALRGKKIFDSTCSVCHGLDGEGQGELGFKLTGKKIRFATDEQIKALIAEGNLPKGMPPFGDDYLEEGRTRDFGKFSEPIDFRAVVAYIRVLQNDSLSKKNQADADAASALPPDLGEWGNPANGEKLFNEKARCSNCHSVGGKARRLGPSLQHIGARMKIGQIYLSVATPSAEIGRNYRIKELRTRRGKKITGIFRNETSDSIELLTPRTRQWKSYDKKSLRSYRTLKTSPMPEGLLEKLSDDEVSDLMAYLTLLE